MSAALLLERVVLAVLCAATLATQLVVARNGLPPTQTPWTFALLLWAAFVVAYLLLVPPLWAAALGVARVGRKPWLPAALLAGGGVVFAALAAWWNPRAVTALATLPHDTRAFWAAPLGAGLAVIALATLPAPALVARLAAAAALLATAAAFAPQRPPVTPVPKRDLPGVLTRERLLVVALDGVDWRFAEPLIARGDLPHLKALRERGAWGALATLRPTASPIIWTTAFTGVAPDRHGIDAFTKKRLKGVEDETWPALRNVRGVGLREIEAALDARGMLVDVPVSSEMRRVPALWNVASAYASPLDVVEVWATWPAEPILGHMVTDRAHFWPLRPGATRPSAATHPPALWDEIAPLVPEAGQIPYETARRYLDLTREEWQHARDRPAEGWDVTRQLDDFLVTFETARRTALHLMQRGREKRGAADDMVVYVRMIDQFSHTSLGCSELVEVKACAPDDQRRFGRVVSEAYRATDAALGEWLEAFGDGNVVVLSDHGWERQDQGGRVAYGHAAAPPGIFVAAGPAFTRGKIDGLGVADMMPLFLRLKGFAIADDFLGHVPERVFAPGFLQAHAESRIPSYGTRERLRPAAVTGGNDEEVKERLRALGYIE